MSSIINIIEKERQESLSRVDQAYAETKRIIDEAAAKAKEELTLIEETSDANKRRLMESQISDAQIKGRSKMLSMLDANIESLISDTVTLVLSNNPTLYKDFIRKLLREALKGINKSYIVKAGKQDITVLSSFIDKTKLVEASFDRGFIIELENGDISLDYTLNEYITSKKQEIKRVIVTRYFPAVISKWL